MGNWKVFPVFRLTSATMSRCRVILFELFRKLEFSQLKLLEWNLPAMVGPLSNFYYDIRTSFGLHLDARFFLFVSALYTTLTFGKHILCLLQHINWPHNQRYQPIMMFWSAFVVSPFRFLISKLGISRLRTIIITITWVFAFPDCPFDIVLVVSWSTSTDNVCACYLRSSKALPAIDNASTWWTSL